jgi:hypothetical protein
MNAARIATNPTLPTDGPDHRSGAPVRAFLALPAIRLTDGVVEGLKWLALVLMTLDHVDKYLLHARVQLFFAVGRLAFPLFGFVLAFNLARPGALERGVYRKVLGRLAWVGALSEIPFIGLGSLAWGWYPLDILVTLIVSTSIIWLLDVGGAWRIGIALALFLVGGATVEFWWPGIALCVAAWSYCRRPRLASLALWVVATAALYLINRNLWALAAFPLILYAPHARWRLPRIRWAFYGYYPAHLAALWALSLWLPRN